MRDTIKKILGIALTATVATTAFVGCGGDNYSYKGDDLGTGFVADADAPASSNGGFAVEKGEYVYFINGSESYTAENVYGDVVRSALLRISKTDLDAGNYGNVKTVVPSMFVAQNFNAGIYIYADRYDDEYVYYATPTTDKNLDGDVENSYIDFKRAKLDGTEGPMKDYFVRLSDNAANYRFVQVDNGDVYCLYEEDGALKSHNTDTGVTTTLVSGAKSSFFFDSVDVESGDVYYTMSVKAELDSDAESYDQLYRVNVASTAEVDAENASYTVKDGAGETIKTYSFNKADMEEANDEAKEDEKEEPYDFDDYTTYPYVNLGTLVLDGIGSNTVTETQYNWDTQSARGELDGYTYTVSGYADGALYFTRAAAGSKTNSDGTDAKLYRLADSAVEASGWNMVTGNGNLQVVAPNTTNTASALYYSDGDKQYYIYVSGENLVRAGYDNQTNTPIEAVTLAYKVGAATLWKIDTDTDFLYYYVSGTNGNTLTRIKCVVDSNVDVGDDVYLPLFDTVEAYADYQPVSLDFVEWNSSWYKPELFGDVLLYSNPEVFGASATNNYVYAAKLGTAAEIKTANANYQLVKEAMDSVSNADVKTAMQYYFRTGLTGDDSAFETVRDEYSTSQQEAFDEFVEKFADGGKLAGLVESKFIQMVGKISEDEQETITEAWKSSLLQPKAEEEDEGLPTWALILIICGGVIVVAAVAAAVVTIRRKKKAAAEAEATVNAYKRKKIDTTDDKSIDVYADEDSAEETSVEEVAEENSENNE